MAFCYDKLKDPAYFRENRLDAHSSHVTYANTAEREMGETSLRESLNGCWKFFCARNNGQMIEGFEAADYNCRVWEDIVVPGHIQMQGHGGVPQYANVQYPWDGVQDVKIGEIPKEFNPIACYAKYFYLPERFEGKRVFITFEGAESCIAVWLNGRYVGFSSDSFTASEFELTPYLVPGENKLACRVERWSAGSWLEDQDFFRFSGIYRDVYLHAVPQAHVRDIRVKTLLDDAYTDAVLDVQLKMDAADGAKVRAALMDGAKEIVSFEAETAETVQFSAPVKAPRLWSAEHPNLYTLNIEVVDDEGKVLEATCERVGFRRFEMKDGMMHINGKRIVIKGTNRHDFCAETGRAVPKEKILRDLLIMKRYNINAIRTSHYPNTEYLYELCDELGLYVCAENNMETHATWDQYMRKRQPLEFSLPGNRMEWLDILLDRVNSTYQRDKNRPSIIMWSIGNESFGGEVPWRMSELFRELDDTRLVHYESINWDRRFPKTSDMESQMYTSVADIRKWLSEHRDKPFLLCEYTHSMGNSNGAMHKYTEYAYEEPLYQGGFIWDFIDQAIRVRDRYGKPAYLYGGDLGDHPADYNFSGNGIVFGNGQETPKLQEVKYNYQNIIAEVSEETAVVHNRSLFTDVSEYACVAILERDGKRVAQAPVSVSAAPGESVCIRLPFGRGSVPGEYAVTLSFRLKEDTAWAKAGHEVAFAQGVYRVKGEAVKQKHQPLRVVDGWYNTGVIGENFEVLFTRLNGGLASYRFGGRDMFKTIPMPNFWRAPTDNDRGCKMPARYSQWKIASLYAYSLDEKETKEAFGLPLFSENEDGTVSVRFAYKLPTQPEGLCLVTYTVCPCGYVTVNMSMDVPETISDLPEYGMMFKLDADYEQMRWYGMGPDECHVDRQEGARLGLYEKKVTDNVTPYLMPQECGNRTGVRWAEVRDAAGFGMRFEGDGFEFSALPYTPHELESAAHPFELPPVHYTVVRVSLMQMGVGGDDSWGAKTHDEYLIHPGRKLEFSFRFGGVV